MAYVSAGAFSNAVFAESTLTIPNAYPGEAACQVKVPETAVQCIQDSCSLPPPASSTLKKIVINFGCAPASDLAPV